MGNDPKYLSSIKNPLIKQVVELSQKSRVRKKTGYFTAEGLFEIGMCVKAQFDIEAVFYNPSVTPAHKVESVAGKGNTDKMIAVSAEVFEKIAYRADVENAVVLARTKHTKLSDLVLPDKSYLMVVEGVEKPGNIGAILRTADALGATAVLMVDSKTDIFNPNVIRSSVGSVFALPVIETDVTEAQSFMRDNGFEIFTTFMENATPVWDVEFPARTAIVVGEEHAGVSDLWRSPEFRNITIPMSGLVDSLNVSVALSLLSYEVIRQQKSKH